MSTEISPVVVEELQELVKVILVTEFNSSSTYCHLLISQLISDIWRVVPSLLMRAPLYHLLHRAMLDAGGAVLDFDYEYLLLRCFSWLISEYNSDILHSFVRNAAMHHRLLVKMQCTASNKAKCRLEGETSAQPA